MDKEVKSKKQGCSGYAAATLATITFGAGFLASSVYRGLDSLLAPTEGAVYGGKVIHSGTSMSPKGIPVSLDGWTLRIDSDELQNVMKSHPGEELQISIVTNSGQRTPLMLHQASLGGFELFPEEVRPFVSDLAHAAEVFGLAKPVASGINGNSGFYSDSINNKSYYAFDLTPSDRTSYTLQLRSRSGLSSAVVYEYFPIEPTIHSTEITNGWVSIASEFELSEESVKAIKSIAHADNEVLLLSIRDSDQTFIYTDGAFLKVEIPKELADKEIKSLLPHIESIQKSRDVNSYLDRHPKENVQIGSMFNHFLDANAGLEFVGSWRLDVGKRLGKLLDLNGYTGSDYRCNGKISRVIDTTTLLSNLVVILTHHREDFKRNYASISESDRELVKDFVEVAEKILSESILREKKRAKEAKQFGKEF